jgi:alpha-mannosidase
LDSPHPCRRFIAQAGLRTFITNKLGWNETNEFPHSTFLWRGIDGTEVLSHCTPGMEYNSTLTPAELRKGGANHTRRDGGRTRDWLQPFGYGDGGGRADGLDGLEAELAGDCAGLPRVQMSSAGRFAISCTPGLPTCGSGVRACRVGW